MYLPRGRDGYRASVVVLVLYFKTNFRLSIVSFKFPVKCNPLTTLY